MVGECRFQLLHVGTLFQIGSELDGERQRTFSGLDLPGSAICRGQVHVHVGFSWCPFGCLK